MHAPPFNPVLDRKTTCLKYPAGACVTTTKIYFDHLDGNLTPSLFLARNTDPTDSLIIYVTYQSMPYDGLFVKVELDRGPSHNFTGREASTVTMASHFASKFGCALSAQ